MGKVRWWWSGGDPRYYSASCPRSSPLSSLALFSPCVLSWSFFRSPWTHCCRWSPPPAFQPPLPPRSLWGGSRPLSTVLVSLLVAQLDPTSIRTASSSRVLVFFLLCVSSLLFRLSPFLLLCLRAVLYFSLLAPDSRCGFSCSAVCSPSLHPPLSGSTRPGRTSWVLVV